MRISNPLHSLNTDTFGTFRWAPAIVIAAGMVALLSGSLALLAPSRAPTGNAAATPPAAKPTSNPHLAEAATTGPVVLKPAWTANAKGPVTAQPTLDEGVIYWGSWDGYEHATTTAGKPLWSTYLGRTTAPQCNPPQAGVASAAAVGTVAINGKATELIFVGGGDAQLYALNADSGAIVWKLPLGVHNEDFLWSSPLFDDGNVYIGDASFGDCPLTQGKVVKVDGATGTLLATFKSVPDGCIGGGVWTALTLDQSDDSLYFATGTLSPCSAYSESLVKVRESDMKLVSHWQIPPKQRVSDGDFGAAPTLFVSHEDGRTRLLVGVVNKNGIFYAFDRSNLAAGPVWMRRVAIGGICPQCGTGSISGAEWDGKWLYVAGGTTAIDGQKCKGSLRALDPLDGDIMWQDCFKEGAVIGAVELHNEMLAIAEGNRVIVVDAATGNERFVTDPRLKASFWSPPAFVEDWIYQGSVTGALLAIKYEA